MINHLLFAIALMTFSLVSAAAATPMDASQAAADTRLAVLHKDVVALQGGISDKDVVIGNVQLGSSVASAVNPSQPGVPYMANNELFAVSSESSAWQPIVVLCSIIGLIVFFVARKSDSAK